MTRVFRQWWHELLLRTDTPNLRLVRRTIVAVIGFTVLLFGVILIVLPGPAFLVIPAGLAILGLEFEWARLWLNRVRELAKQVGERTGRKTAAQRRNPDDEHRMGVLSAMHRPASESGQ